MLSGIGAADAKLFKTYKPNRNRRVFKSCDELENRSDGLPDYSLLELSSTLPDLIGY